MPAGLGLRPLHLRGLVHLLLSWTGSLPVALNPRLLWIGTLDR
jgi:hypothetical protein